MNQNHLQSTNYKLKTKNGFTLIELAISIAILAVIIGISLLTLRPGDYLARGRDNQRKGNILSISLAIGQRIADNKGVFETGCAAGVVPATVTKMATGVGNYDIGPCLAPAYIPDMPFDPRATGAHYVSTSDYDTGYTITKDAASGRVTIAAPSAELETITYTR